MMRRHTRVVGRQRQDVRRRTESTGPCDRAMRTVRCGAHGTLLRPYCERNQSPREPGTEETETQYHFHHKYVRDVGGCRCEGSETSKRDDNAKTEGGLRTGREGTSAAQLSLASHRAESVCDTDWFRAKLKTRPAVVRLDSTARAWIERQSRSSNGRPVMSPARSLKTRSRDWIRDSSSQSASALSSRR